MTLRPWNVILFWLYALYIWSRTGPAVLWYPILLAIDIALIVTDTQVDPSRPSCNQTAHIMLCNSNSKKTAKCICGHKVVPNDLREQVTLLGKWRFRGQKMQISNANVNNRNKRWVVFSLKGETVKVIKIILHATELNSKWAAIVISHLKQSGLTVEIRIGLAIQFQTARAE